MKLNGWDHSLKVTADGKGIVGHAGAVLLRKGSSLLLDRGTVLVSLALAIALGATSMSDIALLAHLSPVPGAPRAGRRSAAPSAWPGPRACWTGSPGRGPRPGSTPGT